MKFIVGYPNQPSPEFMSEVLRSREKISEVYFSFSDMPSGRSSVVSGEVREELEARQFSDIGAIAEWGIPLNLLFNGNCYGAESLSRSLFNKIGDITDLFFTEYTLRSVTTASPIIAKFIKTNFPKIDVRASVNMEIGTPEAIDYLCEEFDSFYLKRELNRNLDALLRMKEYSDKREKKMYLLANSGCLNFCSARTFHDNLVSHEREILASDNGYSFVGICKEYLKNKDCRGSWLSKTNFIRPEDMHLYEGITDAVKLATRVNPRPTRILRAYVSGSFGGAMTDILEPSHTDSFYPEYVDNSKIPTDFLKSVFKCDKRCETCGYCSLVQSRATIKINDKYL